MSKDLISLRESINSLYHADETQCADQLLREITFTSQQQASIAAQARIWVEKIRATSGKSFQLAAFFTQFGLSTEEGIALMALAEALLRIPDNHHIDKLIEEQLSRKNWGEHADGSSAWWMNASAWGLLVTGKIVNPPEENHFWSNVGHNLLSKMSMPVIRQAIKAALRLMGQQFILGETIEEAQLATTDSSYLYSFDMLGEGACTQEDAERYFQDYLHAIQILGKNKKTEYDFSDPSISVKLSALHPRYEFTQWEKVQQELLPRLLQLAIAAKSAEIGLTIDAEEAIRLDISLDLFELLARDPDLRAWDGLGLAVQAYQKRAPAIIDWLIALAKQTKRCIPIRLVKGAYWDSEIKYAQERGFSDYPVFTRKQTTDVNYIACAKKMLQATAEIYSQFATHNAYTIATILDLTKNRKVNFEWQRLQGMGDALYELVLADKIPCRIYAPVGKHEVLLPYLARRLLENGANSSFVHQIADDNILVEKIIADPLMELAKAQPKRHPRIPLPIDIYGAERQAAKGYDLSDRAIYAKLNSELQKYIPKDEKISSLIATKTHEKNTKFTISSPSNTKQILAHGVEASPEEVEKAIEAAVKAWEKWAATPVKERAECLLRAADLLEQRMPQFMAIAIYEAGKTQANAIGEVREAIDYCRYYATQAIRLFSEPKQLPGPTGESNILIETGRGVIVCISPWNFPLAIFLGQVTASLGAGNVVIAKPAEQTPLMAYKAVQLLYEAGIPKEVLQLVLGAGETVGATLVGSPHVAGVVFTGSVPTAQLINRTLANKSGPITPLIAETGGVNAMVVDSTALLEQVVRDVLSSAFDSAGQRCSALRVLLVQEEIADALIKLLSGSMQELQIGDPSLLVTDIGPVIDNDALQMLHEQQQQLEKKGQLVYQLNIPAEIRNQGRFFAPCAYELKSIDDINAEIFGPVLVTIRYKTNELPMALDKLQAKGFGLTFGIQTRLSIQAQTIAEKMPIGNIYINRNMIGAVVGCQPFGGQGLSGTGPKAGGPHYLSRLTTEKVISVNTAAIGGNVALMGMD